MKVNNPQVLYALSACFAAAFAGVGFVYINPFSALVFATVAYITSFATLRLAWRNRDDIDALKQYADPMAMTGMTLFLPAILVWGLLPALLILLAFAQLALNLQLVEHKHVHYGLLVSFICLFMGAAEAITGYYLIFMALYAATAALCLSYLNSDRKGSGHVPFHPFSNMILLVWLLSLALIVYLVIPRPPAANMGSQYSVAAKYYEESEWQDEPATGDTGGSDDDTDGVSDSSSGNDRVMESSAQDPSGFNYGGFGDTFSILNDGHDQSRGNALLALMSASHGAYLKVESFDRFDGLKWHKSLHDQQRLHLDNLILELDHVQEANYQHTITLVNNLGAYIPAASVAVKLHFPADSIALDAYQNLKLPGNLQKDIVYTVESYISHYQQRPFAGTAIPPKDHDLSLYEGFDERIARLAEQVTQDAIDNMSKALLLEAFLKQNYQYDADSIFTSQQDTPLDRFLFETKAGHCEFFASALAVMLRSQGIPSRLVTGFSATTLNPLTGYYEIYSLDGHAWVEAWIEGKGWMLLEATPPYQLPDYEPETITANQVQKYVEDLAKYAALGHDETPTLAGIWSFIADQFRAFIHLMGEFIAQYAPVLIFTATLLLTGGLLYRYFRNDIMAWQLYWRVKRYRHCNTAQDAVFYMQHIHQLLQLRNQPRLPGDSIESFCLHTALQGLDSASLKSLSDQINKRFYKNMENKLNGELFKGVFFHIYNHT